jgi:hypothetical protein
MVVVLSWPGEAVSCAACLVPIAQKLGIERWSELQPSFVTGEQFIHSE